MMVYDVLIHIKNRIKGIYKNMIVHQFLQLRELNKRVLKRMVSKIFETNQGI